MESTGSPPAGRGEAGKGGFTVLFDGRCPICVASVSRLREWDRDGEMDFIENLDSRVEDRFPWIPPSALKGALHLVGPGGETWEGAAAVERIMRILPGWRRASWLFRLPLVRPLARRIYRWVASNRYRFSCREYCSSVEG